MLVTINVLASDFKNNRFFNCAEGMEGCPLERAFTRAGYPSFPKYVDNAIGEDPGLKIFKMFNGEIPVEDFSFEIKIPKQIADLL